MRAQRNPAAAARSQPADSSEIEALTREITKLRQAIERQHQALLNGRDAARYIGYSHPVSYALVSGGVIPQVRLTDDMAPRYARVVLDRLIEEATRSVNEGIATAWTE